MADEADDDAASSGASGPAETPDGNGGGDDGRSELDPAGTRRNQRSGLGMLGSLVLGYGPLHDAFSGVGSFEEAIARYLACLGASVGAALAIGGLLDGAPPEPDPEDEPGKSPLTP